MNFLIKTFLYIATFFLFSLLFFSTFFSPQYEKIKPILINNISSKYEIINSTGSYSNTYIENISEIDSIYYNNTGSYIKQANNQSIVVELKKGIFLLNINDLTKMYTFSHKGFNIKPIGTGIFYIDTTNKNNIKIFSKESILKIGFKDLVSGEILNTAFLYPHEYIIINPLRNRSVKNNADFIRVKSQVFKSGYINDKISYENKEETTIGKLIGEKSIYFFNSSIKNIILKNNIKIKKFNLIKLLSPWIFPGKDFIEKYISYFYNDSKKIIYYKNNIVKNNLTLFGRKDLKTYVLRNKIKKELITLKNINENEYNEMINFTNYIFNITLGNSLLDNISGNEDRDINISRKLNFYNLQLEISNQSRILVYPSSIYIKSIFSLFDKGEINNLNEYLNNFITLLYKDLKVKNHLGELSFDKRFDSQIDYLSFYIRNYISYMFLSNISIKDSLNLINSYIILSKNIYFNSSNKDKIKTGVHEGIIFLEKLDTYIRNKLFKEKRNTKGLLVKRNNNLNIENIKILNLNIKKLNLSISNNIKLLENTKSFKKTKKHFSEYFEALLDYELYVLNYDKIQNNFLNIKTIGNKNTSIKLSKENFLKYIMQFDGINNNSINNLEINIIDKEYYQVKKIYINGSGISFNLYPYYQNKINKIYILGVEKDKQLYYNSTYFLDKQKKELEKKAKKANIEEKDKYDFKRFFINKFFKKKNITNNNNIAVNDIEIVKQENESKIIIVFKSNILLGKTGEFKIIKNIINIKYSDLSVKRNGDIYDINIDGSLISTKMVKNKKNYGLLYGDYILNTNSHYFNEISIKFYLKYDNKNKLLGIGGKKVNILGKIDLENFENIMNTFFLNTQNIEFVYNTINSTYLEVQNLNIDYDIITNKVIFTFKNRNKNIEISFKGSNITNIYVNNIEIEGFNDLSSLPNILLIISK